VYVPPVYGSDTDANAIPPKEPYEFPHGPQTPPKSPQLWTRICGRENTNEREEEPKWSTVATIEANAIVLGAGVIRTKANE
jgi:hypothetical protein